MRNLGHKESMDEGLCEEFVALEKMISREIISRLGSNRNSLQPSSVIPTFTNSSLWPAASLLASSLIL